MKSIIDYINEEAARGAKRDEKAIAYARRIAARMEKMAAKKDVLLNTESPTEMTEVGQKMLDDLGFKKAKLRVWFDNYGMTRAVGIWNFDLNGKTVQGYRNFGGLDANRKMFANYGSCLMDLIPYAAAIEKGFNDARREMVENEIYTASMNLANHFRDTEQRG